MRVLLIRSQTSWGAGFPNRLCPRPAYPDRSSFPVSRMGAVLSLSKPMPDMLPQLSLISPVVRQEFPLTEPPHFQTSSMPYWQRLNKMSRFCFRNRSPITLYGYDATAWSCAVAFGPGGNTSGLGFCRPRYRRSCTNRISNNRNPNWHRSARPALRAANWRCNCRKSTDRAKNKARLSIPNYECNPPCPSCPENARLAQ